MRIEKAAYSLECVGPGGRGCPCCAPVPKDLKRWEHRKARRTERQHIEREMAAEDYFAEKMK
jgi:hypothetical protein